VKPEAEELGIERRKTERVVCRFGCGSPGY
jgi:hypothetical protein